jgi:Fe-S-cluster-containing hydrogenase component 2
VIANYGYKDGAGDFFITIDTDKCLACSDHGCVAACPAGVLEIIEDDYEDLVCAVTGDHRKRIKYSCAPCKPDRDRPPLPCVTACGEEALTHSW